MTGVAATLAVASMFLMVLAGLGKRRFSWRERRCVSCGRPLGACTCRWL
jgi:hypothetical protein